jgi:glutamate-1-semialdehyde aminotransferase
MPATPRAKSILAAISRIVSEVMRRSAVLVAFRPVGQHKVRSQTPRALSQLGFPPRLMFEGHYHGWSEAVFNRYHAPLADLPAEGFERAIPGSTGMSDSLTDVIVVQWNDLNALERCFQQHGSDVAAGADAVLDAVLADRENIYAHLHELGDRLAAGIDEIMTRLGVPHHVHHLGPLISLQITTEEVDELANYRDIRRHGDFERYIEWQRHLQRAGVYFHPTCLSRCSSPRRTPRRISPRPWDKWKKEPDSV